jgi:hypothetical protein
MAPFFRWLSVTHAFNVAHVTGALIMASAAWPAYLLARRATTSRTAALFVAALTVAIPWLGMSATLMLEPIAYPAFCWAVLAMVNAIARPGWRADGLLLVAIGIAFAARTQLAVLALAFVVAVVIDALLRRDTAPSAGRRLVSAVREHSALVAIAVAGTALILVTGSEARLLGSYSDPAKGALIPSGTGHAMHELLAYVVVGIGGLPLAGALAWVATTLGRRLPRDVHAVAAVTVAVVVVMTLMAGSFSVRFTEGINDRYLFYIAPLLFTGLAAGLAERPRGFVPALAVGGLITVVLVWTSDLAQAGPSLVSPSTSFHQWLVNRAKEIGGSLTGPHLAAIGLALVVAAACVLALRARSRVATIAVCTGVLVFCIAETAYTFNQVADTQSDASAQFLAQRGWMDRALPYGARAAVVLAPFGDFGQTSATWWDQSFWNNAIRGTYRLPGTSEFDQGITREVVVDPQTGRVPALDPYGYVVRSGADTRFGLRGSTAVASQGALLVLKADRPYQADWLFEGKDPDSATVTPGQPASVRAFGEPGVATVAVVVGRPGTGGTTRFTITSNASRRSGRVKAGQRVTLKMPARFAAPGVAKLQLSATGGPLQFLEVGRTG